MERHSTQKVDDDNSLNVFLTYNDLNPIEGIEFVKCEEAGAVILFGGITRNNFENKEVENLSYEAHVKLATMTLLNIAKEARSKFTNVSEDSKIHKIYLCHRLGNVPVKEESILVTLSSTHRQEGWDAAMWILERVKEKAEIWKKELYNDGSSSWKENETSNVLQKK